MINIVLFQPEIFQNTANIIRTCLALEAKLHIIKPTAFDLHPHWLKRAAAGVLLSDIEHEVHQNYNDFWTLFQDKKIFFLTRYSNQTYSEINFRSILENNEDIFLVFGRESTGIDKSILQLNLKRCLRIPMSSKSRSLNLANSVAIIAYEVVKQNNFLGLSKSEVQKGSNYLYEDKNT